MLTKEELKDLLRKVESEDYSNLDFEIKKTGPKKFVIIGYRYPEFIHQFAHVFEPDYKYTENIKYLFDNHIEFEEMNIEQLSTSMTYILRAERFCEGTIAGALKDKSIERILKRYLELI